MKIYRIFIVNRRDERDRCVYGDRPEYKLEIELEGNSRVLKQTYFINKDIFDIDGEIINSESIESGDSHIHTFLEGGDIK